jgi:hypothetical protein
MVDAALSTSILPSGERLRMYFFWSFWVGVSFFGVYPAMNWIMSLRAARLHLSVSAELAIPFIPQFIWGYLSMFVLFLLPRLFIPAAHMPPLGRQLIAGSIVSAVLFLLLPAELGFVRTVPARAPYAAIYAGVFGVDRPHNLVASLHVIYSTAIAMRARTSHVPRFGSGCICGLW